MQYTAMQVRVARLAVAGLATALAIGLSGATVHADEGWIITSFHSDITIAGDSTLTIKEDIRVDFGSLQKHGIFRTIPLRYRFDDSHDRYYLLDLKSVTNGSRALQYSESVDHDNDVIKIGDPNVLVSGTNRYVITYTVIGVLNSFTDNDELFWNVDGALWPVPKRTVTATVSLPPTSFQKAACFEGPTGSKETCTYLNSGRLVNFTSTRMLGSGEQMSVVVALSKGAVTVPLPLLEARKRQFPQDAFEINPLTVGLSLLIAIGGIGMIAWNWWVHGRDRAYLTQYYLTNDLRQRTLPLFHHDPEVVEFEPPQKMRPAQLGLILDEKADPKDVTATIVDLAVRGYMTINEIPGKLDWTFIWKDGGDAAALLPYEKTVLDGLFAGRKQVNLSELKGTFGSTLRRAEGEIYKNAVAGKLFTTRPDIARAEWGCLGLGVFIGGIAVTVVLGLSIGWGLVGVAVVLVGLLLTISFPFMPQRSAAGRELLQRTLGFRLYMTTAEKYRQQFAAKAQIFTQLLPYAIVFGCVSMWAKAFEGIDTSAANSWYVGNAPFQAAFLASSLQSMDASISSAITYTPPGAGSSSGFGGGGSSGGGGGGGGGGSW
jgi:type II secretory pathway pseudopilin PulG